MNVRLIRISRCDAICDFLFSLMEISIHPDDLFCLCRFFLYLYDTNFPQVHFLYSTLH